MAKLVLVLEEQPLDRQPPTVVIQATTWWEALSAHVKLQECGLGVYPLVRVCCYWSLNTNIMVNPLNPVVCTSAAHTQI